MTTVGRVWDIARMVIAAAVFVVAGTMLAIRLREEIQRSAAPASPSSATPEVSETLRKECEQGKGPACLDLGLAWLRVATPLGEREARRAFDRACRRGDPQGCHDLGRMLAEGTGGAQDRPAAQAAYLTACDAGLPWSCHAGALFLLDDDPVRAATMLTRACDAAYAAACYELALLYDAGRGVSRDTRKAHELLDAACRAGEGRACAVAQATTEPTPASVPTSPRR